MPGRELPKPIFELFAEALSFPVLPCALWQKRSVAQTSAREYTATGGQTFTLAPSVAIAFAMPARGSGPRWRSATALTVGRLSRVGRGRRRLHRAPAD